MPFKVTQGLSTTQKGSRAFAVGITSRNTKEMAFNKAEFGLDKQTGQLLQHLRQAPFEVVESADGVRLELKYILKVRFLDLRKDPRTHREKINYVQIYNRLLWGYTYGHLYPQLRYGFTNIVREKYIDKLRNAYKGEM